MDVNKIIEATLKLGLEEAREKVRKAKAEADQAELMEQYVAYCIKNDRNPMK